jgi:diguanylate cyclase (GGDEF)-like protein
MATSKREAGSRLPVLPIEPIKRASSLTSINIQNLCSQYPSLLVLPEGANAFVVKDDKNIFTNPFIKIKGDSKDLGIETGSLSFSSFISDEDAIMPSGFALSKSKLLADLSYSKKSGAPISNDISVFVNGERHFYSGLVYYLEKESVFLTLVRRLKRLEDCLNDFIDRSERDDNTGLLNKTSCLKAITEIKKNDDVAVVFLDLNNFKLINDVYGHLKGDIAIKEFAVLLNDSKPSSSNIYRFGGDEFVSIVFEPTREKLDEFFAKLDRGLQSIKKHGPSISYSAGAVRNAPCFVDPLYLLRCSDVAMYCAKKKDTPYLILSDEEASEFIKDGKMPIL